ncbi:hypothetical protein WOSG25_110410 [Weissella oryzae SG25]|uniref:Uncharacterized protein n=1 Tax=Weissella oryzae (strain DSM 25784 / JCM 18191 / LMG 30913 / SG25) TaxID=1329250 RepID=A0A069CWF4_WEIOS|nr:hypothetical protein [Weissella oryzae]GAK31563.1 hypothetical protein WOSG25_110410 [Weissella oryzae SG25]
MTRTLYDDFAKEPIAKMSQSISNMTFAYNETKVPAKHYKAMLGKQIEEVMETATSVKLVEVIYNTLTSLKKESPRLFFQALLLLDLGIKPNSLTAEQYQALTVTSDMYEANKLPKVLDRDILSWFNDTMKHGLA